MGTVSCRAASSTEQPERRLSDAMGLIKARFGNNFHEDPDENCFNWTGSC